MPAGLPVGYNTAATGILPTFQGERSFMGPIRNSAIGVGIASGIAVYVFIHFYPQMAPRTPAFDLLAALCAGLAVTISFYLYAKLAQRQLANPAGADIAPVAGAALPSAQTAAFEDMRQVRPSAVATSAQPDQLAQFVAARAASDSPTAQSDDIARRTRSQLAALCQVAHDLSDDIVLDEILRRAVAAAAALTSSQHATMLLLNKAGDQIASRITLDQDNIAPLGMVAGPMMRQGLAGWVVRERRAVLVPDVEHDPRWLPGPGLGDMRSALAVPLLRNNRVLGVITLADEAPEHYGEDQLQLLTVLGAYAALAIENAWLSGGSTLCLLDRPINQTAADDESVKQRLPSVGASPADLPLRPARSENIVAVSIVLRGFGAASEQLAPEVLVDEVLDIYLHTMTAIIQRHSGYVDKCSDDGILALFGHTEDQQSDELRAVQAALASHQASMRLRTRWKARFGIDLGVAIGIGRGRIAVGQAGLPGRHDYLVIGDAVKLAGHLQSLARPGEILAAAEIVDALNDAGAGFAVEALPPLPAQGQHSLQSVYRIAARAGSSGPAEPQYQPKGRPTSPKETTP